MGGGGGLSYFQKPNTIKCGKANKEKTSFPSNLIYTINYNIKSNHTSLNLCHQKN